MKIPAAFLSWRLAPALAVMLLLAGSVFAFSLPGFGKPTPVTAVNGKVSIPVTQVADGKARHYRFADNGREIRFFVVKGTDGAFHVAFDACDACYKEKKGYSQKDDFMVCGNCNMKFATNRIGKTNSGGCNPSHLDFALSGDKIVVKVDDLKAGARFF